MKLDEFEGTLVEMEFGSRLYGLATPDSDYDYAGVYMPSLQDILLKHDQGTVSLSTNNVSKNRPDDVDRNLFSLWKFIEGCKKGNTSVLDMLHAPKSALLKSTPAWECIVENRHRVYTKNMRSFVGYLRTQSNRYGVKGSRVASVRKALKVCAAVRDKNDPLGVWWAFLPTGEFLEFETVEYESTGVQYFYVVCGRKYQSTITIEQFESNLNGLLKQYGNRSLEAEKNDGIDWKAVSHALRVGYQTRQIFKTGTYSFPLQETDFIFDVKLGNKTMQEVRPELDSLVSEIDALSKVSGLPECADSSFWDNLYLDICRDEYGLVLLR